ncbi:hypothetical protein G5C60_04495 [Streptomyces sp. HC44]|uniref:Uncharacterized protein n=1 Tax=Streptomyces scabichelini TaxID=2711217 RepID=A0A6G4UYS5_9ACTN|nr:hypothetical protein [Streptomyces scabichelini]NGO06938.1 hypothetical protein [Streptomyces scabichelini]
MRRTTALISGAAVAVAGGITGTAIWLSQPSYDDVVKDCQKALAAQIKAGGKGKPSTCNDVEEDDYSAILMHQIMDNEGWLDEDGRFDKNKMFEDAP